MTSRLDGKLKKKPFRFYILFERIIINHYVDHSDIKFITGLSNVLTDNSVSFSQVSVLDTTKKLKSFKSIKACGYDKVSALISKNQLLK